MLIAIPLLVVTLQQTDSLTLSEALARARANRPRIVAAAGAVDRARGTARLGTLIPNPAAQVEADDLAPTYKATVSQPLSWLLRRPSDARAGRAGIARAQADSVQVIADVARDVRRAFFGALAANRQLALAAEQASFADSLAQFAARRAAAGDISDLERDQINLEAYRSRITAAQARESALTARLDLARAIAWPMTNPPAPAGPLDEALDNPSVPSSGETDIPAVVAAVADSTAAVARLHSARVARFPVPGLVIGSEWGGTVDGKRNLILGVSLPVPLWSQGGEAVAQARGAATEQSALLAESRLVARSVEASARVRVDESTRRARFARDSLLPEARRIRAGAVRLYEEGRTSAVPVLDALRAEREIIRLAVLELLAFQEARAELDAVLGRWP